MQIFNRLLRRLGQFFQPRRATSARDELTLLAQEIVPRSNLQLTWLSVNQKAIINDIYQRLADTDRQRGDPTVILFTGGGGTGKMDVAEVMANDLHRDLYRVDLNRVVSRYVRETEKNLRSLFRAAESAGAILFFDEADELFGRRSEVRDSHDRYANLETSYLLQLLEQHDGLAILATNSQVALENLKERFHLVMDFPCRPRP